MLPTFRATHHDDCSSSMIASARNTQARGRTAKHRCWGNSHMHCTCYSNHPTTVVGLLGWSNPSSNQDKQPSLEDDWSAPPCWSAPTTEGRIQPTGVVVVVVLLLLQPLWEGMAGLRSNRQPSLLEASRKMVTKRGPLSPHSLMQDRSLQYAITMVSTAAPCCTE